MKNHWHYIAISATVSIVTKFTNHYFLFALLLIFISFLLIRKAISLFIFFASIFTYLFFTFYLPSPIELQETSLESSENINVGEIIQPLEETATKIEFVLQLKNTNEKLLVIQFKRDASTDSTEQSYRNSIIYGATCVVEGEITLPDRPTNPGQFDYRSHLLERGLNGQIIVSSAAHINCEGSSRLSFLYTVRTMLLDRIAIHLDERTEAWMKALLFGDDTSIDEDIIQLFQRWSLSHILAISGLHIGIIVAILYFLLVRLQLMTQEKAQTFIIVFLPIYALIAGSAPSVWRASLMVVLFLFVNKLKLKYNYTDILSVVFLLVMIVNKYIVFHIGFQFSFLVTFGLIVSTKLMLQVKSNMYRLFLISFISQMMILPLQLHYFHHFQPLSIILNVLVVPYFSFFIIPLLFILFVLLLFPTVLLHFIEKVFLSIHDLFLKAVQKLDMTLNFPFVIGTYSAYFAYVYYVLFVMFLYYLEKEKRRKALRYGVMTTILIVVLAIRPIFSPIGNVTMLDIGQGDTFIVELPYRQGVFFIDAGAELSFPHVETSNKTYKQIIKPYLYARGITKIDAIFISHEHADHYGSIHYLLNDFKVNEIIISELFHLEDVVEKWKSRGVDITRVTFNEQISRSNHLFQVVSPKEDQRSENENSLVIYTQFGALSWLFTGDIGKPTEIDLITHYENLQIDVLKVGHHGSNTSTSDIFVEQLRPKYALIPVGINNIYGHPAESVLQTLKDSDVHIYRTDINGAVQYFYKGDKSYFVPFIK